MDVLLQFLGDAPGIAFALIVVLGTLWAGCIWASLAAWIWANSALGRVADWLRARRAASLERDLSDLQDPGPAYVALAAAVAENERLREAAAERKAEPAALSVATVEQKHKVSIDLHALVQAQGTVIKVEADSEPLVLTARGAKIGLLAPWHEATLQIVDGIWCLTSIIGIMLPATLAGIESLVDPIPFTTVPMRAKTCIKLPDGTVVPAGTLIVRRDGHIEDANA